MTDLNKLVQPDDYMIGRDHAMRGERPHYPHNSNYMRGYERGEMVRDNERSSFDGNDMLHLELGY